MTVEVWAKTTPLVDPATIPNEVETPVELTITLHHGAPPLLPKDYSQAKLWAKGRTCLRLGRNHVLRKSREGYLILEGKRIVNAFLVPLEDYTPPFYGSRDRGPLGVGKIR